MRDIFVSTLLNIAKKDKNVLLVTGDLGFGVLNEFWKQLPNQIINVGIAEQNMIGFASGLAKSGKIVYVYSIANFPSLRPFEQIRNDVVYHNLNVKVVSIGAGFSYGSLGITHHATEDIGVMRSLPKIRIYSPANNEETEFITNESYLKSGPCYLRLGRLSKPFQVDNLSVLDPELPRIIVNSTDKVVMTYGEISHSVIDVLNQLKKENIHFDLAIFHTLKPISQVFLAKFTRGYKKIIVIEEHSIYGGLSSIIKDHLNSFNFQTFLSYGINDTFTSDVGDQDYLRKINGLDNKTLFTKLKMID